VCNIVRLLLKHFFTSKNSDSLFKRQQTFCKHLDVSLHRKVPCHSTIQLWVENFRTNASALKNKPPSSVRTVRLSQNTEAVRQLFIISPRRSASRHYVAPRTSDHNARTLNRDLNFHPYKMYWCKS
jgi:hypothetical protein